MAASLSECIRERVAFPKINRSLSFQQKENMRKAKYGFLWVTLALFLISLAGHWIFGWFEYRQEQSEHNQPVEARDYMVEMARGTLENWQSEFLQLIWQVAGLAFLWHVGSPQSKEGDDRKEEKLDLILQRIDPDNAQKLLNDLERKYPKK